MKRMMGDDPSVMEDFDATGSAADLDTPADAGERHGLAALESDLGIIGDGAGDGDVEGLGQETQRREPRLF